MNDCPSFRETHSLTHSLRPIDIPPILCYNDFAEVNTGRFAFLTPAGPYNRISDDMSKTLLLCGQTSVPVRLSNDRQAQEERFVMLKFNFTISLEIGRPRSITITNGNSTDATWQRLRSLVRKRDNNQCYYCGTDASDGHVDHIVPISRGGTDAIDNLVWSCPRCNSSKGDKLISEWENIPDESFVKNDNMAEEEKARILELHAQGRSLREIWSEIRPHQAWGGPRGKEIQAVITNSTYFLGDDI